MPGSPHNPSRLHLPFARPASSAFQVSAVTTNRDQGRCPVTGWPTPSTVSKAELVLVALIVPPSPQQHRDMAEPGHQRFGQPEPGDQHQQQMHRRRQGAGPHRHEGGAIRLAERHAVQPP